MYKVVFWMNIPSHYQRDFFAALNARPEVDLHVRYFEHIDADRRKLGWGEAELAEYEAYVSSPRAIREIPDYRECVHVILGDGYAFNRALFEIIRAEKLRWVHWSEPYGLGIWEKAHFRPLLARPLMELSHWRKRGYGKFIRDAAHFVMGQGISARRNFVRWGVPAEKIRDLYYCGKPPSLTEPELRTRLGLEQSRIFFNIGQLNYRKGIDLLLEAFSRLKRAENWKLVLVGHDYTGGFYQELVRKLKLDDRVLFLPAVSPEQIGNYINLADVLVLPSRYDGWGIVLNEAAALGKALIGSTMAGASHHVIKPDVNGWAVAPAIRPLSSAMQRYVDQPELLAVHGAASKIIFEAEFSADRNAERMVKYLREFQS